MSLAAVRVGLPATLVACGPWSASEISASSFDVLTNTAAGGCAIVILPGPFASFEPESVGAGNTALNYKNIWQVHGTLYIQDTGDAMALFAKAWQAHDDLRATIAKDVTLQGALGANGAAYLSRIAYNDRAFMKISGRLYSPVDFWITVQEF